MHVAGAVGLRLASLLLAKALALASAICRATAILSPYAWPRPLHGRVHSARTVQRHDALLLPSIRDFPGAENLRVLPAEASSAAHWRWLLGHAIGSHAAALIAEIADDATHDQHQSGVGLPAATLLNNFVDVMCLSLGGVYPRGACRGWADCQLPSTHPSIRR